MRNILSIILIMITLAMSGFLVFLKPPAIKSVRESVEGKRLKYLFAFFLLIGGFGFGYWSLGPSHFGFSTESIGTNAEVTWFYKLSGLEAKNENIEALIMKMELDKTRLDELNKLFLTAKVRFCPTKCVRNDDHWHTIEEVFGSKCNASIRYSAKKYFEWIEYGRKIPFKLQEGQFTGGAIEIYDYYWISSIIAALEENTKELEDYLKITALPTSLDYFYFSIVSITTTGYGDFTAKTPQARIYVSLQILAGMTIFGMFLNSLANHD